MEKKTFSDRSYGLVQFCRVNHGGAKSGKEMFMSDIGIHNFIELTIRGASVDRTLSTDWPHAEDTLIKVQLTPTQYTELLTNMNVGEGVPCTISFLKGEGYIDYKPLPSKIDIIQQEAIERVHSADEEMKAAIDLLQEALKGKGYLNKTQIKDVMDALSAARYLWSNDNFAMRRAQEDIDKMVVQAKSQISAYVDHKIYSTGIAALQEGFVAPQLIEGEEAIKRKARELCSENVEITTCEGCAVEHDCPYIRKLKEQE